MSGPLSFCAKLLLAMAASIALFALGHAVDGRPEPDLHTVQNAVLALLGTWSLFAVAARARLARGLWRLGGALGLVAPAAIAVTQASQGGTLFGIGWAAAALGFALFGHGAGAMAREWTPSPTDEDPLKRLAAVGLAAGAAALVVRLLVAPLPDGRVVSWLAGGAALLGAAMATAAPALSAAARARLTMHGVAVAALLLGFVFYAGRGNPLVVWSLLLFLPAYAEARWRPARGAGASSPAA